MRAVFPRGCRKFAVGFVSNRVFSVRNRGKSGMDSEDKIQKLTFSPMIKTPDSKKDGGGNKRMSVERIYQKKTQLEHILLRPDTYIGSVETVTQPMWVWDGENGMVNREITFVPGLYKIFDEILVNAADNKQRDPKMSKIKIEINGERNLISVWNDGKGIPVVEHKEEKLFVPELIFGHLLTSSNYDDDQKKVTGGRNGYGAKLCNIFSTKFTVETSSKEYRKKFKMTWTGNMAQAGSMKLSSNDDKDYTCISFMPDLKKFGMDKLDADTVALLSRRAYDIAGATKGVTVYLNGTRLPVKNFKDYVELYTKKCTDENGDPYKTVYEQVNPRWEVCITLSEKGFQHLSFVNSIATTKGGRHVDYIADQVVKKISEIVKKKNKGGKGVDVKPFQIKNHCWIFVNCLIENPTFDSQTKENMTLVAKKFGSTCSLSEKFLKSASSCGIVDGIMNWVKFKTLSQMSKKMSGAKSNKIKGIPKLDDANDAGTRLSEDCTLILTEGDSAKTLAVSGLSVVGRDKFGVFPLRGKVLNVREATHNQIMQNSEINNIIKIMGLQYNKKYADETDVKSLRYGRLMIMTDQDHDGSHIKGLLINFIHANWPKLLHQRVVEEFITPIVKVSKGSQVLSFYSVPEFEDWENSTANSKSWKVKYYKGLGTSTAKEAKEYFADMARHRIRFKYGGPDDDGNIDLAFNKKRADDRKEWLSNFMASRRQRREDGRPDDVLYNANVKSLTYSEFVNRELILYSCADVERSLPSLLDGLKPGQRKVLFTCLKRNDKREVKVAQLAGSVAELSAYHHGEASLMTTIINMAQNYVGSNNINLLQPIGQFGTRLHGGKDAASPRYIFTMLSPLTRLLFPALDDNVLTWCYDDNQRVEPEWYCPIIPMILVNGTQGIGTGWSTFVPNHDVRDIVDNIRRLLDGDDPKPMNISYKNFRGQIEEIEPNRYAVFGEVSVLDEENLEITELPVKTWTQNYKESVLEPMFLGTEKTPSQILEYKEYNTDITVRFKVKMSRDKLRQNEGALHKFFNLQSSISCTNLVMFDELGCLRKFPNTLDILKYFYNIRLQKYHDRKEFLLGLLTAEAKKLSNQARFIVEKIDGVISIFNKPKKELIKLLVDRGYDSDPVKAWKVSVGKKLANDEGAESEGEETNGGADFNYILNMPLWSLSKEKKEDLLKQKEAKQTELDELVRKTPSKLWRDDLDKFMEEFEKVEKAEQEEAAAELAKAKKAGPAGSKGRGKQTKLTKTVKAEVFPSPHGIRVAPRMDDFKPTGGDKKTRKAKIEDPTVKKLDSYFAAADKTKKKPPTKKLGMDIDDDVDKPLSLAERVSLKKEMAAKSRVKPSATKQTKLNFKPKPKGKGKKKDPWDTSEEESDGNIVLSSSDSDDFKPTKKAKKVDDSDFDSSPKKSPAKKTLVLSSGSEDDNKDKDSADLDDIDRGAEESSKKADLSWDEIMDLKPPSPVAKKAPTKRRKLLDTGSSEDVGASKPPKKQPKKAPAAKKPAKTAKPAPKKAKKKDPWDSDSDSPGGSGKISDSDSVQEVKESPPAKKTAPKARAKPAPKKARKKEPWGSDSDSPGAAGKMPESDGSAAEKSPPAKKKAAKALVKPAPKKSKKISDSDASGKSSGPDSNVPIKKSQPGKKAAPKAKAARPVKKGAKKDAWASDSDVSLPSDSDTEKTPPKRTTARRDGAAKAKYVFDSDDNDSDF